MTVAATNKNKAVSTSSDIQQASTFLLLFGTGIYFFIATSLRRNPFILYTIVVQNQINTAAHEQQGKCA